MSNSRPDNPILDLDDEPAASAALGRIRQTVARLLQAKSPANYEDLTQETMLRGLTKIKDGKVLLQDSAGYFVNIAKLVLLESYKKTRLDQHRRIPVADERELENKAPTTTNDYESVIQQEDDLYWQRNLAQCQRECLAQLKAKHQQFIVNYPLDRLVFTEDELDALRQDGPLRDAGAAPQFKHPAKAAFDIRQRLARCVHACLEKKRLKK